MRITGADRGGGGLRVGLQRALLKLYQAGSRFRFVAESRLYRGAYFTYKRKIETPGLESLRPLVRPGTTVIDVGANIGFFSVLFDPWVGSGRVIALEPERRNFEMLNRTIQRYGLKRVEPLRVAATDVQGVLSLHIDPLHPGNHMVSKDEGEDVQGVTIDDIVAERGLPEVSLIKIDTQGHEAHVVRGASETIRRHCPALFVEVDEKSLSRHGSSLEELIELLKSSGYEASSIGKSGWKPLDGVKGIRDHLIQEGLSYADILFNRGETGQ